MAEQSSNNDVEEAFNLIEAGNQQDAEKNYWCAAERFLKARDVLRRLGEGPDSNLDSSNDESDESKKILELYREQSREYFQRSRKALINAIQMESESDREKMKENPPGEELMTHASISDDEAFQRLHLFGHLFVNGKVNSPNQAVNSEEKEDLREQEKSLEERLAQLNKSLPKGFQTSDERMKELDRGLKHLGISFYSHSDERSKPFANVDETPKSTSDQVAEVIAQARDEVAMMGPDAGGAPTADDDDIDDDLEGCEEQIDAIDDEMDQLEVEDKELSATTMKKIRDKIADAQAKLAELNALFEIDEDENAEIQFDQDGGKQTLRDARKSLEQATHLWRAG